MTEQDYKTPATELLLNASQLVLDNPASQKLRKDLATAIKVVREAQTVGGFTDDKIEPTAAKD